MRRRKLFFTLLFGLCLILTSAALLAGRSFSLAKEEKELFSFENIKTPQLYKVESLPAARPSAPAAKKLDKNNLTALLAGIAGQYDLNSLSSVQLQSLAGEMLDEILPQPSDLSEINISFEASAESYENELKKLEGKYISRLPSDMFRDFTESQDPEPLKKTSEAFSQMLGEYQKLEVPPDLAGGHMVNLELLKKIAWIFEAIKNYQNDPIKALVAFELLPKISEEIEKMR